MLEEHALNCKLKFRAAQKLAEASALTASRMDLVRKRSTITPVRTRASSVDMEDDGSDDSKGVTGRGGR